MVKLKLIKQDYRGKVYETDNLKIFYRKKNSISGDNSENVAETIYFVHGSAEITLEDKAWKIKAPEKIEFPAKTYHKIKALTDIIFVLKDKV